jgi:biopolymer transport protein ExbB/TolQ
MDTITNVLYWLTTGLLVPVVVLLLIFFARALLLGGSFYGQFIQRNKIQAVVKAGLKSKGVAGFSIADFKEEKHNEWIATMASMFESKSSQAMLNHLIGEYEIIADKELGKSKTLTKLGPMLGLMGTLIPMGPALVGLATGDVASMASNMQVAFATTVIGVFIGAVGFITLQVKQRWYADDMNTLEFIAASFEEIRAERKINHAVPCADAKKQELVYETK